MIEIWKDIEDYEGLYQVSNLGQIKSLYKNKIIKPSVDKFGYARFSASKNKIQKTLRIHRIVLITFNPTADVLQINHINGIKLDNSLENLEWCTDSYNKKHAYKLGLMIGGNQYTNKKRKNLPRYK